MALSAVMERGRGGEKATLHKMGREAPEVAFELSPTWWSTSTRQRCATELFAGGPTEKRQGLGRAHLVLGKGSVVDDKWTRETCLEWSREVDQDQTAQGLEGHTMMFILYSRSRRTTLGNLKPGSVVFYSLCRHFLHPSVTLPTRSNQKVIDCLCTWQPKQKSKRDQPVFQLKQKPSFFPEWHDWSGWWQVMSSDLLTLHKET